MKKMLVVLATALALVGVSTPAGAQNPPITQTISTTTCPGSGAAAGCAVFGSIDRASTGIQIQGTFVGTLQFEQTIDNVNWVSWSVTPFDSATAVTSATGVGLWTGSVTNFKVRVRFSAYTSGSAVVTKVSTVSSRGGSGGGGSGAPADATFITQTPNGSLSNEQALSTLATGILSSTTGTGVVASNTTSAAIAGLISDETGTGALVFGSSPTIVTPTVASFTNATHTHQNAAGGGQLSEAALNLTDVTTANATASAHGFMPKLSGNAFDFTLGNGTYSQTVARGTVTASSPWDFTQTYNNAGVTFDGFKVTITNTASASASRYFAVFNGATCMFGVGRTTQSSCYLGVRSDGGVHTGTSANGFTLDNGPLTIPSTQYFQTAARGFWHSASDRDFQIGSNGSAGVEYTIKVGAVPTISLAGGCGTGATISGTNSVGRITIGSTPGATCTITFSQAWTTNAPHCDANNESSGVLVANVVPSTTAVVLTGTFVETNLVSYHCAGWQ